MTEHTAVGPREVVRQLIMGFRTTQLIYVATTLGLPDLLSDGPQGAAALSNATGAHPQSLYRLLRALASVGIFEQTDAGEFRLNAFGQTLRSGTPGSLRDVVLMYGDDWIWDVYDRTLHSVMTGSPAFEHVHDCSLFEYMRLNGAAAATFNRGMTAFSEQEAAAILRAYDSSGTSTIVDVGGGQGALLAAILRAHPQARGVLFETSNVIESAREALAAAAVADRCALIAGDFFEAIPVTGEVYILKSVLHNWDADRSVAILQNCRRAIHDTGRPLVIERLEPDGRQPSDAKLFDINMLVMVGALERTTTEYRALFQKSGFELARVISTGATVSVLEATGV